MVAVSLQEAFEYVITSVGREAKMTDPPVFFLFYQIREDSVFLVVQIGVDVFLIDIVEEIEVKIVYLAFLQLFSRRSLLPGAYWQGHSQGNLLAR